MNSPVFDYAVVGAGIAGASVAHRLSVDRGSHVVVLEREAQPGYHSTGRSAAMFIETYGTPTIRALTRASRGFYERPPADFADHPLLAPRSVLHVAASDQGALLETAWVDLFRAGPRMRRLAAGEARATVPVLRESALSGAILEDGAQDIDVHALHQGYLRGLRANGSVLHTDAEVLRAERTGDTWTIAIRGGTDIDTGTVDGIGNGNGTGNGIGGLTGGLTRARTGERSVVRARTIIDAAGAWADSVARACGVRPVGLEPRRRTAFVFDPPDGIDCSGWPAVVAVDETFYFKPDAGRLLGSPANADPVPPHDVVPEELDVAIGIDRIQRATSMTIVRPRRAWAGLRSFVRDGELVVGWDDGVPGFFWLAAQGGYGIQTAAGVAELAAALLRGEGVPERLARLGVDAAVVAPKRLR